MSKFTTPLILEHHPDYTWEVFEEFEYYLDHPNSELTIRVPKGFKTDLASIPRILWWLLPPFGPYGKAAVLHDYCYATRLGSKKWADDVFFEAMGVLGVSDLIRYPMYWAVRIFGRGKY